MKARVCAGLVGVGAYSLWIHLAARCVASARIRSALCFAVHQCDTSQHKALGYNPGTASAPLAGPSLDVRSYSLAPSTKVQP